MPRKKTTEEIDLLVESRPLRRVGEYVNYDTKIEWSCTICFHTWSASPGSIISLGSGCPVCGQERAGRAKSAGQLDRVMATLTTKGITLVSPYTRIKDRHDLRCDVCGFEWRTTLNIIVNHNRGCARCSGLVRLTNEDVDRRLYVAHGDKVIRVGDYVNATTKIEWRCDLDHVWKATPDSVLNFGSGCPLCNRVGVMTAAHFATRPERKSHPGTLYLVKGQYEGLTFLKVGITSSSVARRFHAVARQYEITTVHEVHMPLYDAYLAEQEFLRTWVRYAVRPSGRIDGKTECLDMRAEIIEDFKRRFPITS